MTKYNVGDKVLIRKDLREHEVYGHGDGGKNSVVSEMLFLRNKVATIDYIYNGEYRLREDGSNWGWTDDMIVGKVVKKDSYQVGDKVLMRDNLSVDDEYETLFFSSDMEWLNGEVVTISYMDYLGDYLFDNSVDRYICNEMIVGQLITNDEIDAFEEGDYDYNDEDFLEEEALVVSETEIINQTARYFIQVDKVIFNEPATVMFYRVPKTDDGEIVSYSKQRKVVAKCNPYDLYDRSKGFNVCVARAIRKEMDRYLSKI